MLTTVLQAGGMSTRMGVDKGLMPFLGMPLIERLLNNFGYLPGEILIISNNLPGYEYLDLPIYQDVLPGRGALGGLLTALTIAKTAFVGLIAADMPFASAGLLSHLLTEIKKSNADAVLPSTHSGPEPFHAVYRRDTCLPLVKGAIEQDLWRMTAWHDQARIKILNPRETSAAGGADYTFINLNTPEEFTAAEELARKHRLL